MNRVLYTPWMLWYLAAIEAQGRGGPPIRRIEMTAEWFVFGVFAITALWVSIAHEKDVRDEWRNRKGDEGQ